MVIPGSMVLPHIAARSLLSSLLPSVSYLRISCSLSYPLPTLFGTLVVVTDDPIRLGSSTSSHLLFPSPALPRIVRTAMASPLALWGLSTYFCLPFRCLPLLCQVTFGIASYHRPSARYQASNIKMCS